MGGPDAQRGYLLFNFIHMGRILSGPRNSCLSLGITIPPVNRDLLEDEDTATIDRMTVSSNLWNMYVVVVVIIAVVVGD